MRDLVVLLRYQLVNVLRAKWLIIYALFFFLFVGALLTFGGDSTKVTASVLSIVLLIVPMISILYGAIYWYDSVPFIHLLLAQPIRRSHVFLSIWLAVSLGLAGSFALSVIFALLFNRSFGEDVFLVVIFGCILSFIFVALGQLISVIVSDRMKGVGLAFLLWFYFSILHDALVFGVASSLRDRPIEIPTMILMAVNPVDLVRVRVLLTLDLSAMMGYTGKILQHFLSGAIGGIFVTGALLFWTVISVYAGVRIFSRADI